MGTIEAVLGLAVFAGFMYFIWKKVKESRARRGGGGGLPKDNPPTRER